MAHLTLRIQTFQSRPNFSFNFHPHLLGIWWYLTMRQYSPMTWIDSDPHHSIIWKFQIQTMDWLMTLFHHKTTFYPFMVTKTTLLHIKEYMELWFHATITRVGVGNMGVLVAYNLYLLSTIYFYLFDLYKACKNLESRNHQVPFNNLNPCRCQNSHGSDGGGHIIGTWHLVQTTNEPTTSNDKVSHTCHIIVRDSWEVSLHFYLSFAIRIHLFILMPHTHKHIPFL